MPNPSKYTNWKGIKMFKILDGVCKPQRATKHSACVDLYAREDAIIGAGETIIIPLGIIIDLEQLMKQAGYAQNTPTLQERFLSSHYLALFIRSSLGVKGLIIPNGQGVIDLDYPDEIGLIIHYPLTFKSIMKWIFSFGMNDCHKISKGDKVAQCTILEHKGYLMGYESNVTRIGGFGSTSNSTKTQKGE